MVVHVIGLLAGCPIAEDAGNDKPVDDTADTSQSEETGDTDNFIPEDADADGWFTPDDCNDADAAIHPEAEDGCDGIDQDCDGDPVAEGACGSADALGTEGTMYWEGSDYEGAYAWLPGFIGDEIVTIMWLARVNRENDDSGSRAAAALVGLPTEGHDWMDSLGGLWLGERGNYGVELAKYAGDVVGDGTGSLVLGSYPADGIGAGFIAVVTGPVSDWPSEGAPLASEAVFTVTSVYGGDDFPNEFEAGGIDMNGDGFTDVVARGYGGNDDAGPHEIPNTLVVVLGNSDRSGSYSARDEIWLNTYNPFTPSNPFFLPDANGDGILEVGGTGSGNLQAYDGATMLGCQGCEAASFGHMSVDSLEQFGVGYNGPRASPGDLNGDGTDDVALSVWNPYDEDIRGCAIWLDGSALLDPTTITELGDVTRVCADVDRVNVTVGEDSDEDGIADMWAHSSDGGVAYSWLIPSTLVVFGARVEMEDIGLASNWAATTIPDHTGDGFPEFLGYPNIDDPQQKGRTDILPGFDIPWDDRSKW